MKLKILFSLLLLLISFDGIAQCIPASCDDSNPTTEDYCRNGSCIHIVRPPDLPNASNIVSAEYYIDNALTPGSGSTLTVGTSDSVVNFTRSIPINQSPGFHFLAVRLKDADGKWGMIEVQRFYVSQISLTDVTDIVAAEYFFDGDPGPGAGNAITVTAGGVVNFAPVIPVSLAAGFHMLSIRVKDTDGKWGMFETQRFYIAQQSAANVSDIVAAEYFIDNDPGTGSGITLSIGSAGPIINFAAVIPVNLTNGFHTISIRIKDADGKWSVFETNQFFITPPASNDMPVITGAEYFFDNDPGVGHANPLSIPASGDTVSFAAGISVPCLSAGQHFLSIRLRDQADHWSLFDYDTLNITAGISATVVSPAGPISICSTDSVILSAPQVQGIHYQWLLNGNDISNDTLSSYTVHAGGSYSLKTTCGGSFVTSNIVSVIILPDANAGTISGRSSLCTGETSAYTSNGDAGGIWSSSNTLVAAINSVTGLVTAIGTGSAVVSYMAVGCTTPSAIKSIIVGQPPNAGTVSGPAQLCIGAGTLFSSSGDPNGTWSSSNSGTASVNINSGFVTANNNGTANIIYTVTSSFCSVSTHSVLAVNPNANAGSISAPSALCLGNTFTFSSNGNAGGDWSSSNAVVATINPSSGFLTVHAAGQTTITYLVSSGCNNPVNTTKVLTVNPDVNPGVIAGNDTICLGESLSFTTNGNTGGYWSSNVTSIASVDSLSGTVQGLTSGNAVIIYIIPNGCGAPASANKNVTVSNYSIGNAGLISGTSVQCIGSVASFSSDGDSGGSWSSSNSAVAVVDPVTGVIATLSQGIINIIYTVNGCHGPVSSQRVLVVKPDVNAGLISGSTNLCTGAQTFFITNGTSGGNWSSSNNSIAAISSNGSTTPISNGNVQFTYTVTGCGGTSSSTISAVVSTAVTPGSISSPSIVCLGDVLTLTNSGNSGGTWSSSNPAVAPINNLTGLITGLTSGVTTIEYKVSGCNGQSTATRLLSVLPVMTSGNISGKSQLCIGDTTLFISSGTSGGQWSSDDSNVASVNSSTGLITGLSGGTTTIRYTVSGCGNTSFAAKSVTVNGHLSVFTYSGNAGFTSAVVSPSEGESFETYRFEISYSDADNDIPSPGYPRLIIDYENNGSFSDPLDFNVTMTPALFSDMNVTDGKIYFVNLSGIPKNINSRVYFYAKSAGGGCESFSAAYFGPQIKSIPNLSIFANDIVFSNSHPALSSPVTVSATINNDSSLDLTNITVHLINQYDTNLIYPDIIIPFIEADSFRTVSWNIITPAIPSWNPMQVVVDYGNGIEETNELDNQAIRPFTNGNFTVPGRIRVTAVGSGTVCQDDFYTICGSAIYQNTAVALQNPSVAGATVEVTLAETGQVFSGYTNNNGQFCISLLPPDSILSYSLYISVTDFTLTGDTSAAFSVISCPVVIPNGPDLTSEVILNTGEVFSGVPVSGIVKISNEGNQPAAASIAHFFVSSAGPLSAQQFNVPSLMPGAFFTFPFTLTSSLSSGRDAVEAMADATEIISELIENNNKSYAVFRICPLLPDLLGGSLNSIDLQSRLFCDNYITYSFSNKTCLPVNPPFDVLLQIFKNSQLVYSETRTVTHSLGRDSSMSINFPNVFAEPGNYFVKIFVDAGSVIDELDETNNVYQAMYEIIDCKADLAITAGCSPVIPIDPQVPGNISIYTTLVNGGAAAAKAPFIIDFENGGNHYPVTITADLPASSRIQVIGTIPTPAYGCPKVTITTDPTNAVEEYHEYDTLEIPLSWDFQFERICFDEESGEPNPNFWEVPQNAGEPVSFSAGILNMSTYTASNVHTKFEVSGPQIGGWLDLGLANAPNVTQTCGKCLTTNDWSPYWVTLPNLFVFPDTGIYQVRITIDSDDQYIECDETNNVEIVEVAVTSFPDYRILSHYIAPSMLNPEIGQPISIDVTYQNIGPGNLIDSLNLRVKVDNLPHETVRVKGLLKNAKFTAHCTNQWASLLPGLHVIRAIADSDNELLEGNEFNNEATRSFVVGKASDLYFQVFEPTIPFPQIGENITLNARIGNAGDLTCSGDVYFYYLNDNLDTILIGTRHVNVIGRDSSSVSLPWTVLDNKTTLIGRIDNMNVIQIRYDNKEATAELDEFGILFSMSPGCFGGNDGSLKVNRFGGVPPFTVLWSNGSTGDSIYAPPGIYTVSVTDLRGSVRLGEERIFALPPPPFYEDADGDGFGNPGSITEECFQPAGYVTDNTDCNDGNSNINPGEIEVCNGLDDDCDGQIDEGVMITFYIDEDDDGYGNLLYTVQGCSPPAGYVADSTDCNDALAFVNPGMTEICNGYDDNCSGQVDEGLLIYFYRDFDGDGYGNPNAITQDCFPPAGYSADNTDCDDLNDQVNPGEIEICNLIDDNCNGVIDEGCTVYLHLNAFIEGFYLGGGQMIATVDPVMYPTLCDTVRAELRNALPPYNILYEDTTTIDINGNAIFGFPFTVLGGQYYIALHHRNAMETWSSMPEAFNSLDVYYSFTDAAYKAYGNNLRDLEDGNFAIWSGDISDAGTQTTGLQDGVVESMDYSDMENAVTVVLLGYVVEDITGDGVVESNDYSVMENNVYWVVVAMHP